MRFSNASPVYYTMKKYIKTISLSIVLLVSALSLYAQPDDWKVNASSFEYSMSVTTALYYNDQIARSEEDYVAAFIDGQVRGVAKMQYVEPLDRYIAFMLVFDNNAQGNAVSFKIFQAATGQVVDAVNNLSFESDRVYGTSSEPYYVSDTAIPLDIAISNRQVTERRPIGTVVGTLSTFDIVGKTHNYLLVSGEGDTDNSLFTIVGSELRTNAFFNAQVQPMLSVRIESINELNLRIQEVFTIEVESSGTQVNPSITDISLSSNLLSENSDAGILIGTFELEGTVLPGEEINYGFIEGEGSEDNSLFEIIDNELRSKESVDFEEKEFRSIRVIATSASGGVFEKQLSVRVTDVNEAPIVLESSLSVPENSARGTVVGTIQAIDPEGGTLRFERATQTSEGSANQTFDINLLTGELIVNNSQLLDFERNPKVFVEIAVTDGEGLRTSFILTVALEDVIEAFLPANNIVTPNGDGFNDTWEIRSINSYEGYSLLIYNTAGKEVYQSKNYQNDWAGTYDGKPLPSGVFYYVFSNGQAGRTFKGAISIIR